ncbi:hypothetical protein CLOM_g23513, partial [Closterium sp. NIES-68]
WSGQNDSDAAAADTIFQVKGDRANPVTNLHVTILDAAGLVAVNDFRAKASILPSPAISGLLQATSVNGRATIPPSPSSSRRNREPLAHSLCFLFARCFSADLTDGRDRFLPARAVLHPPEHGLRGLPGRQLVRVRAGRGVLPGGQL